MDHMDNMDMLNVPATPRWSSHLWSNYFRRLPGSRVIRLGKTTELATTRCIFASRTGPELFLYVSILIRFDIAWWKFMVPPLSTTDWIYPTAPGGHCADAKDSGSWDSHEATWAVLIASSWELWSFTSGTAMNWLSVLIVSQLGQS